MLLTSPSLVGVEVSMGSCATCTAESAGKEQAPEQAAAPLHNEAMWGLWGVTPGGVLAVALGLDDSLAAEPAEEGGENGTFGQNPLQ